MRRISAPLLAESQDQQGITLRGPTRPTQGWQAQAEGATLSTSLRWIGRSSACAAPRGMVGGMVGPWRPDERPCHFRGVCPRRLSGLSRASALHPAQQVGARGLPPQAQAEALEAARTWYASAEGQQSYKRRAGVEGTLSQGVRGCGLRCARYRGLRKTHGSTSHRRSNQYRSDCCLAGGAQPRAKTRTSRFAALAPACALPAGTPPEQTPADLPGPGTSAKSTL